MRKLRRSGVLAALAVVAIVAGGLIVSSNSASAEDVTDEVTTIPINSTVTRELVAGIPNRDNACAFIGSDAEFSIKVDNPTLGVPIVIAPGITATITGSAAAGYSVTIVGGVVADILIKAGPTYNSWYHFDPSVTFASPLFAPDNKGISHITFCSDENPPARLTLQKFSTDGLGNNIDFEFDGGLLGLFLLRGDGTPLVFDNLTPGAFVIGEINLPAGWNAGPSSCDNGQLPGALTLVAGDDVTCTFNNSVQLGAVKVHKERKHAALGTGDHPHEGVEFTVTNPNGTNEVITTDANGEACVDGLVVSAVAGDYTVTETVPAGYESVDAEQDVTVVEGDCDSYGLVPVEFDNVPLTDVSISVDSQVDGGTASVIECTDIHGNVTSGVTDALGDGTVSVPNLLPTDPAVTLTCTVIVDP